MKFGFYVSNSGTRLVKTLNKISTHERHKKLLSDISFVFRDSVKDDALSEICKREKIILHQQDFDNYEIKERGKLVSEVLLEILKATAADYLFVFGCKILKGDILELFRNKIINFHPSLLPAFPGMNSIDKAVDYGSFITGNTAHFIDQGIDSGQIIMQNIHILKNTFEYDDILDNQIPMLLQIMTWLKEDRISLSGRKVIVKEGKYIFSRFVPNLEIDGE